MGNFIFVKSGIMIMCPSMATCQSADNCFSELSTIKIQPSVLV